MTIISRSDLVLIGAVFAFVCATVDVAAKNVLAAENQSKPHITFSSPSYTLKKTKTDVKVGSEGWSETARWENSSGDDLVYVHIFAHVTYNRLIMRSHVRPPNKRIGQITRGEAVSLGARGKAEIERGFYEYQAYSVSDVPCIYIQSYWGDRSFSGVDVVRGAKASDKIVGNHMLQVVVCDQRKKAMGSKDVTEILSSIDLHDAYWSGSWFDTDIKSVVPSVTGTETTLDSQASIVPKPDSKYEGVSGTYRSTITGRLNEKVRTNNLEVELVQDGNSITGTFDGRGKIWGEVIGNTVKFDWVRSDGGDGKGKWIFKPGSNEVRGTWFTTWGGTGDWNLTRIE